MSRTHDRIVEALHFLLDQDCSVTIEHRPEWRIAGEYEVTVLDPDGTHSHYNASTLVEALWKASGFKR